MNNIIKCKYCFKKFKTISSKNKHLRNVHNDSSESSKKSSNIKCSSCTKPTTFSTYATFMDHLSDVHSFKCTTENLEFENESFFIQWKKGIEKTTKSYYTLHGSAQSSMGKVFFYECHRSNLHKFESKCTVRASKISGSIKINGACPSRIRKETYNGSDTISVVFVSSHFGHSPDLKSQPLSATEKEAIINKIKCGVPFNQIIEQAREIDDGNGINLLTKKKLHYIADKYVLTEKRQKSDFTAVDSKVAEWNAGPRNNVFIYKKPGQTVEGLHDDDFVLAYMISDMEHMLKTYGSNIICMDGTCGTNHCGYQLSTILIIDHENIGHPAVFLITNRKDKVVHEILLQKLKSITGVISPKYFMSDDTNFYFDVWCSIMSEVNVPQRLLFTWNIKKNWAIQTKSKIQNKEIRRKVHLYLDKILRAVDEKEFFELKELLFGYLKNENQETFLNFLKNNYFQDEARISSWAHCYRLHAGINTNIHFETLNKILKYNYFSRKSLRELEACLDMLDKLLQVKSWKRIASIVQLTASNKHRPVSKADKTAVTSFESVAQENSNTYCDHSQTKTDFNKGDVQERLCDCEQLQCLVCKICMHRSKCSCRETSIKNNFCKEDETALNTTEEISTNIDCELIIKEISENNILFAQEIEIGTATQMVQPNDCNELEVIKNKCQELFSLILSKCDSVSSGNKLLEELKKINFKLQDENKLQSVFVNKRKNEKITFFPRKKRL